MSVQLNELIERIKKEGVQSAEEEAARIKEKAEQQRAQILAEARDEARSIVEQARAEAERFEATGREGVRQAARDVVLDLRQQLSGMLESILNNEIGQALESNAVVEALGEMFSHWKPEQALEHEVLVPERSWKKIQELLVGKLSQQLKDGFEIKPSTSFRAGFRIQEKDGGAYYDFTDRGLTEFMMEYLNPRLAETLGENKA